MAVGHSPLPRPQARPDALDPATFATLVARARTGNKAAFARLMQAHHTLVFRRVVAILRHEHDARDVTQEVWLAVWRELPHFRSDTAFTTLLFPIAIRRTFNPLRKRQRWFNRALSFTPSAGDGHTETAFEPIAPLAAAALFTILLIRGPAPAGFEPTIARADYVQAAEADSTLIYADQARGWYIVWTTTPDA